LAKKKTGNPRKKAAAVCRKQRTSYAKAGKGTVEIGRFCTKATWEETGEKEMYAKWYLGEHGGKGPKINVKWRIAFGRVQGDKREALASILRQRAADECSRFTIVLNGVKHGALYLHELAVIRDDPIPCGLVFSNIAP
jgi:hypothetical protein